MSKRKRTPKDPSPPTSSQDAEGQPTVHVSPDLLAGSPDVFAPRTEKASEADEPTDATSEVAGSAEQAADEQAAPTPAPEPTPIEAVTVTPPAPAYHPHPPAYVAAAPAQRRAGSSIALGVVFVVLGLFALLVQFTGFDAGGSWPLFVVIPGVTLLLVGYVSLGTGALIPGAILTVIGLILAYMNATQDWPAWAFVWPLVAPGGVGLGIYLQGLRNHDAHLLRQGRVLMFVAAVIFMIGFVIFGTIFKISDTDYGWFGKAALPALLIVVGILLLARSIQRSRRA